MKRKQAFLVFTFFLFSIFSISAQYGNNGFGGNNNSRGGFGNGGGMNQMNQSPPEKPKEIPVEVTVGHIMEKMKPALNLDALQEIAISNVYTESIREQGVLLKQVSNQEDLVKNFKALSETTDRKINQFLNPDQKEKYLDFKVDSQKPEKKKRKKEREKE